MVLNIGEIILCENVTESKKIQEMLFQQDYGWNNIEKVKMQKVKSIEQSHVLYLEKGKRILYNVGFYCEKHTLKASKILKSKSNIEIWF